MASYNELISLTRKAGADLRLMRFHLVRVATVPDLINIASHAAASLANGPIGVLQNKPNSLQAATVAFLGESKVVAGGSITANVMITTNGSGRATAAVSGDIIVGRAMEAAGADGDIIRAFLQPPVLIHRT